MKRLMVIFLFTLTANAMAVTRDELYQQFGPMEIEAVVLVIKDEINLIRTELGLSERTNQQIMEAIDNRLKLLQKYDWMENRPR